MSVDAHFRGRRVLIAGADGFLGRTAAFRLAAAGADLTLLTRGPGAPGGPPGRRIVGDLADPQVARDAVDGQSVVFDFIGATSAVRSNRDPTLSLMQECLPHINLLSSCAERDEQPLVVLPSSRLVYGRPHYLPVDERHPTHPLNIYGVHKLTVEGYLSVYHETRGVPYLVFRISNPYGPYQGAANKGYGVINQFIQMAARGETIRLFGDGSQQRDYIYADDLVELILLACAEPACHNQIFNVGGREPVSLREVAELITQAAGGSPLAFTPWPAEDRMVETGSYVGSLEKLSRLIRMPEPTPLAEGVRRSIQAYRAGGG
jgi:nucleoside-diphosphate-sugar epimerase